MPDKDRKVDGWVGAGGVVRRRGVMRREKRRSALCSSFKRRALVSFLCQSVSLVRIFCQSRSDGALVVRKVGCMRLRGGLKEVSDQLNHQM